MVQVSGNWIKIDRKVFDTWNSHQDYAVTTTAANGSQKNGEVERSIESASYGGDFGLTSSGSLKHHDSNYSGKLGKRHLLYSYSYNGYDINAKIGSWKATMDVPKGVTPKFGSLWPCA